MAGFGSEYRRDDGIGVVVAAQAVAASPTSCNVGPLGDPLDLLGTWNGADLVVVVDAVRSGARPGTIRVLEMDVNPPRGLEQGIDGGSGEASTHGIGLSGVLRLARALGQAPARLVVVGIEGEEFGFGREMSHSVRAAVPEAVRRVVELIEEVSACA